MTGKIDRRELLSLLGGASSAAFLGSSLGRAGLAMAQAGTKDKFLIYIHAGAWDGLAAGMLQPKDAGIWQRGLFAPNQDGGSVNPNINVHHKTGDLVLNNYTKSLAMIADHVCFAVGTPRSAAHEEARNYQYSGAKIPGANATWAAGLADSLHMAGTAPSIVNTGTLAIEQSLGKTASNVTLVSGAALKPFRENFEDSPFIPKGKHANRFWAALGDLHQRRYAPGDPGEAHAGNVKAYVANLVRGQTNLADDAPEVLAVRAAFNRTTVNQIIDREITDANDAVAVKARPYEDLLQFLTLAGALAKTGTAKGATFMLDNQDLHFGGSSVLTARSGAQMFAQLTAFWKGYIIPQQLQDRVMIVVSHEFSRTAYNNVVPAGTNVVHKGANVLVAAPGTDHNFVNGMIFINGKVPGKSRIGGVGDYYVALGSNDLRGVAATGVPAYTSTRLVGSMLMRCFADVFPSERDVRRHWADFEPIDLLVK